ncbi:MAG TPA: cupin domain-containing protein [Pirellulaceae bacterium]|jgi:mannose-6-phosphate isomerase-like protein (cupin superfamily)|nr:cupin domain-containing protein [Pirellulaceae bacterium]
MNDSDAIVHLPGVPAVPCPCGWAKRAFVDAPDAPASLHLTRIEDVAALHYHREHTETYYVLECEADAAIELDGVRRPVRVGDAIQILPGVRHRAIGPMTILNFVVPPFDPADEWIVDN